MEAIDNLVQEAAKDGCVMVQAGGLLPTSSGMRVRLSGSKLTVTDGPFTEAKEVIGGYAIFDAKSKAHMLKWTERFMGLHQTHMPGWEGECEVRQIQRSVRNPAAIPTRRRRPRSDEARGIGGM